MSETNSMRDDDSVLKKNRGRKLGINLYFGVDREWMGKILSAIAKKKGHRNVILET